MFTLGNEEITLAVWTVAGDVGDLRCEGRFPDADTGPGVRHQQEGRTGVISEPAQPDLSLDDVQPEDEV